MMDNLFQLMQEETLAKLKANRLPSFLYKYQTADTFIKCLEGGKYAPFSINFASPSFYKEHNDPGELAVKITNDCTPKDWQRLIKGSDVKTNRAQRRRATRHNIPKVSYINGTFNEVIEEYLRIGCLTSRNDNTKMWKEYSSFSGVCFQLELAKDPAFFGTCSPVYYDNTVLTLNWVTEHKSFWLPKIAYRKDVRFADEEEYRILKDKRCLNNSFKQALVGIYFGNEIKEDDKAKITSLIKDNKLLDVKFYQMQKDISKGIEFESL